MAKVIGISGNITSPSRTSSLVNEVINRASKRLHAHGALIDIANFASELGSTVDFKNLPESVKQSQEQLINADLIVIGTPVYKASYTGLLKHFFDLLDPKQLAGKVAILVATGGSDQHALVLEYQLRSLASFFGVHTVPTTIYAKDSEFTNYQLSSEIISDRVDVAIAQAVYLLKNEYPRALVA